MSLLLSDYMILSVTVFENIHSIFRKVELDLRPKRLNDNRSYIDDEGKHIPCVKVDIEVADAGAGEHKMESRLEYIKQRPWKAEDQPDFVTNKNRLKFIAAEDYENIEVQVVRMAGIIFMIKTAVEWDFL